MTTFYVKKDGTAPGGIIMIASGVFSASAGDTIEILDTERYNETVNITKNNLIIRSANFVSGIFSPLPQMTGFGLGSVSAFRTSNSGTQLLGLDVNNYTGSIINSFTTAGQAYILSCCLIHHMAGTTAAIADISGSTQTDMGVVNRCKVWSLAGPGLNSSNPNFIVQNSVFYALGDGYNGIIASSQLTTASFCTVDIRGNCGNGFVNQWGIRAGTVNNCIVTGVYTGGIQASWAGIRTSTGSYNCVGITGTPYVDASNTSRSLSTGELAINPRLVNTASGDFRLTATSSCIDAGIAYTSYLGPITYDFSGNLRPLKSGYDMGAFEYIVSFISATLVSPSLLRLSLGSGATFHSSMLTKFNYTLAQTSVTNKGLTPAALGAAVNSDAAPTYIDVHTNKHAPKNTFNVIITNITGVDNATLVYSSTSDPRMGEYSFKSRYFSKKY